MKRPHEECPLEKIESKCPFRFICGQPCNFRSNKLFWAIVAGFALQSAYGIYSDGWDRIDIVFMLLGASLVLWAVFEGFRK